MNVPADIEIQWGAPGSFREPHLADPMLDHRLRTDGYAVVRVMPAECARALEQEIAKLFKESPQPNQPLSNWYLGLIDSDRELAAATARLTWDTVRPALSGLFVGARCHYTSVAIKPGCAGATPMHQHWPSTVDPFARRIGCWVLLSASGMAGGTFRLVPGSHQLLPFIRHTRSGDYFDAFSERIEHHHARNVVLEPGEAILFEDSILHGTGANDEAAMRVAAIANFIGAGMPTATIEPDGPDAFAVIETGRGATMEAYLRSGKVDRRLRRVATLPNRNRTIIESEFVELIALQRKATLDFDPLDLLRDFEVQSQAPRDGSQQGWAPLSRLGSLFGRRDG